MDFDRVSYATIQNWNKLGVKATNKKLSRRANKVLSTKTVLPQECFYNKENIDFVLDFVQSAKSLAETSVIINSLCFAKMKSIGILDNKYNVRHNSIVNFIEELKADFCEEISNICLPEDEPDILGIIYQLLLTEGTKNILGSYYTPQKIINDMFSGVEFSKTSVLLDPCCGSGRFLLSANIENPQNLYGFDIDSNAVKIAKTNLIAKYVEIDFNPQIYCTDFLTLNTDFFSDKTFVKLKADYIISNPPWGTKYNGSYSKYFSEIASKELFSFFIVKAFDFLKDDGCIKFVLPDAFLNIPTHRDIRSFLLKRAQIQEITSYGACFSGVVSNIISIKMSNKLCEENQILINGSGDSFYIPQKDLCEEDSDKIFQLSDSKEKNLIKKIYKSTHTNLSNSTWGLGIVTGDNAAKLFAERKSDCMEPILTGKEVAKYRLGKAKKYFNYDRKNLQQVAKDEIYRAPEKLIYKFISDKLVFAYDNRRQFVINSANILIPNISGMSIKTVCAFLNSEIMQFVYKKSFNQIKVIKGNLCKLPFPKIDNNLDKRLSLLVDEQINGADNEIIINNEIYKFYNLSETEISLIRKSI